MSKRKDYLGTGWAFPFGFASSTGGVEMSSAEENIRQCIGVILSTRPGERQMLPKFGCRLHELLFAPNTRATSALIAHHIREALTRWEPRIEVIDVRAEPEQNGSVNVEVEYVIRATNARHVASHVMSSTR
ncbi:MAG TPA: GPW/gp25 family protein [Myxococcota bacterium]|nr:GPW/gp25 family protein [Myxococcota bacterium]